MFENIPTWALVISGIIVLVGLGIFLFLFFKSYRKHRAIVHYEKMRDKLSLREKEKVRDIGYEGVFELGNIIGGFIVILIGTSLLPETSEAVTSAVNSNVTGTGETILGIMVFFFALAVATTGIVIAASNFRRLGVI